MNDSWLFLRNLIFDIQFFFDPDNYRDEILRFEIGFLTFAIFSCPTWRVHKLPH
jgi:hypothetical protein